VPVNPLLLTFECLSQSLRNLVRISWRLSPISTAYFTNPSDQSVYPLSLIGKGYEKTESQSYITADGQSASLSWNKAPIWDLRPDFYYCQTIAGLLMWALSLTRGRSVVYNCCWSSLAQSFSGPVGLVTIFYCLIFETSLFVAPYDSQVYSGGIRPRIHNENYLLTYLRS
jgi:hypothetical protein